MAVHAAAIDIWNTFFIVFLNGAGLIVALVAVDIDPGPCMAPGTHAIGPIVIEGEGMSSDADIAPAVGAVAFRALHGPVVAWPGMAGSTFGFAFMAELHISPGRGVVTAAALPGGVTGWPRVAGLAVG